MNYPQLIFGFLSFNEGVGATSQLVGLLLFAKANTLWRQEGMLSFPYANLLIRAIIAWSFICLAGIVFGLDMFSVRVNRIHFSTFCLGALGGLGLILFARALSTLPPKLVFFGGTFQLIVGMTIGVVFLDELLTLSRFLVVLVLLISQISLVVLDLDTWHQIPKHKRLNPLIIGVIWGIYYPMVGVVENSIGIWQTIAITESGVLAVVLIVFFFNFKREVDGLTKLSHYKNMGYQASLSVTAQVLTVYCLQLGGVIFQSILSSFSNLINLAAFRASFNERIEMSYVIYFLGYGCLLLIL